MARRREGKEQESVTNINLAYIKILFWTIRGAVEKTLTLAKRISALSL